MKETGKTLGLILILKRYENAGNQRKWCKNLWRKRGENDRKHVVKNAGHNILKTHEEDVLENTMKLEENMITIRGKC